MLQFNNGLGEIPWISGFFIAAWLVGFFLNSRSRQTEELRERAERLELEREVKARTAVAEERARIARELHDIVGHSVSVMTVQASAVRRLLREDQEREREALQTVEETGRAALAEMRRLVGVLRRPEEAPALVPQPSLEYVDKLVEQTREAGLDTDLRLVGEPTKLPQGIDLTAYRFVQEGLTNAIKHANAKHAEVVVRYDNGTVELVVRDDGTGDGNGGGSGHGLVGIRERVAVYGGELSAGPRPRAGTSCARACPSQPSDRPRSDRRRPGARAHRLPHDPRGGGGHRGRRRGGRRHRGDHRVAAAGARRRADGRAHAGARRDRGDAAAARERRRGDTKVVMLTTFDMDEYVFDALRAGASGFLLKDVPPERLIDGIRAVANGDALLAPSITRRLIEEFVRSGPARDPARRRSTS